MTSERKIAANRQNGRKGRGPRTAAGKSVASRNALRHGLAAATQPRPASSKDIERFAKALCGANSDDPSLFAQALAIANINLVLRAISAEQLAVVERVRNPSAIAFAKGDNSIALAEARSLKGRQAYEELTWRVHELLERYRRELPPPIVDSGEEDTPIPLHLENFLSEKEHKLAPKELNPSAAKVKPIAQPIAERDEVSALEEAVADLIRLDRYERRAWSRQKRAVLAFMNIKLMISTVSVPRATFQRFRKAPLDAPVLGVANRLT